MPGYTNKLLKGIQELVGVARHCLGLDHHLPVRRIERETVIDINAGDAELDRRSSFNLIAAQCPAPLLSLHVDHLGSGQRRKLRWDRKWFQARPRRPDREHNQEPAPATPDETGSGDRKSTRLNSSH